MLLQCVHRINPLNTGDIWSAPLRYLPTDSGIDVRFFDIYEDAAKIDPQHPVVIGGGGLFREPSGCRELVRRIVMQSRSQVIIWGAGLNTEALFDRDRFPDWLDKATLCGVRDFQAGFPRWVPCFSCVNALFDRVYPIQHDVVLYYGVPLPIFGLPQKCCQEGATLEEALQFLGSGETVVTNSYHGAYWATLLGRKVVLIPNQDYSKFAFLKLQHVCASAFNWRELLPHARRFDALDECREANRLFADEVGRVLRCDLPLSAEIQRLPTLKPSDTPISIPLRRASQTNVVRHPSLSSRAMGLRDRVKFHLLRKKSVRVLLVHSHPLDRLGGAEISMSYHVRHAPPHFQVDTALPDDERPLDDYHVVILANLRPEGGLGEAAEFAWAVRWTERLRSFEGISIRSERDMHPCGRRDAQCLVGPLLTRVPCHCGNRITGAFEKLYNACSAVQFISPLHQVVIQKLIQISRPQYVIAPPRPIERFKNITPFDQRKRKALIIGDAVRAAPTAEDRARQAGFEPERFPYLSVPYAKMPELYNQYQAVVVDPVMFHAFGSVAVEAMACGCRVLASERVGAMSWPDPIAAVRQSNRHFWEMVQTLHHDNSNRQLGHLWRHSYFGKMWYGADETPTETKPMLTETDRAA